MTDRQAQAEAVRRWGPFGAAWHCAQARPGDYNYCRVGKTVRREDDEEAVYVQEEWFVFGRGRTWEEAFMEATKRGR